ncbi:hypothetical protein BGZ57DRAFT_757700 [Hyaloscypha finlandica]|nr:hypothetical protein BGZ57DRAFT_757700 [Hyaloscypha finlandica]
MDPLSALSVAAAVVQLVDYGAGIVSKGTQLYKSVDGALGENIELETASIRLQQLSSGMQGSLSQARRDNTQGSPAQVDQHLEAMCNECVTVSQELVNKLETLKVPGDHPYKKWKSFRQALKSVWSKEKIEAIAERLCSLRAELNTHVVVSLSIGRIMIALLANNEATQAGIVRVESKVDGVSIQLNAMSLSGQEEHAKTRELLENQEEDRHRRKAELHIRESLRFETMTNRYETISEAHQRTFEWIFRDPEEEDLPWSSFIDWTESGSGIYWINGKAGSGKSTLMRFIVDDPRTRGHLQKWAPHGELNIPAFFFWNSGVPEQCSQAGLLRSIIHDVLGKHTNLIPEVCPEEWEKALELTKHGVPVAVESWSLSRLQRSFERLLGCASEKSHFCFFIDGLDEYDGDYEEISDYFSSLSNLPYVKFCIASRPLIVFKDSFNRFPSLKLQHLTSNDIQRYIKDKLNGHRRMKFWITREYGQCKTLVAQLIDKAEGVFLWVKLVVKSLLKGLSQRDGILQLLMRLDAFPSDLELLYGHMLSLIDPIYMEEGAILFQVFDAAHKLPVKDFSVEIEDDLRQAMKEEVKLRDLTLLESENCSIYALESLTEYMDDMLRTRCGGLIECELTQRDYFQANLHYLHRTARDYLARADVWKGIFSYNRHGSTFDPSLQIIMSYVLRLKRLFLFEKLPSSETTIQAINNLWRCMCRPLTTKSDELWSSDYRTRDLTVLCRLLDEFDRAATKLSHKVHALGGSTLGHWANQDLPATWESDFLCEAIKQGLLFYVAHRILSNDESVERVSGIPLIGFSFLGSLSGLLNESLCMVVEFLLEQGADPNEVFEGHTIWEYFIHYIHTTKIQDILFAQIGSFRSGLRKIPKGLLETFMKSGADLDICCIEDDKIWDRVFNYEPPTL